MTKLSSMQNLRGKMRTHNFNPVEFKTNNATNEGSVMEIANTEFLTIQKENTIKNAADLMAENHVRRIFITEPDNTLLSILTAMDIIDFLGGGDRFRLVSEKHKGNLTSAINEPIRELMKGSFIGVSHKDSLKDVLKILLETGHGGLPVMDGDKIIGTVGERDFAHLASKQHTTAKVSEVMTKEVMFGTAGMSVSDAAKAMLRNHFRRLPILTERKLAGIVTARDLVTLFSVKFSPDILDAKIDEVMHDPVTTTPDELLMNAATLMQELDVGGLPVLDGEKVVGLLTERDIIETVK
ncbi:MAG: CBS domain-containing protein [archaeon]